MGGRIATGWLLALGAWGSAPSVLLTFSSTYRDAPRFRSIGHATGGPGAVRGWSAAAYAASADAAAHGRRIGMVDAVLDATVAEIEAHVGAGGWDLPPALFALVHAGRFSSDEPETAHRLGIDVLDPESLTPIEQDDLPEGPLDEVLSGIAWPDSVAGCVVSQEIVVLPPDAEAGLTEDEIAARAAAHPQRREARLVVGVLRGGASASVLRMRGADEDQLLTGDLAPNLVEALLATLT